MSENPRDKMSPQAPPAGRVVVVPPPVARSTRRTPEQIIAPTSTDTFATPSQSPETVEEAQVMVGPEPAIFGGVNPAAPVPQQLPTNPGSPADEEDEVTSGPLIRHSPRSVFRSIRQSSAALLAILVFLLVFGTWVIVESIPARSDVHVTIHMRSAVLPTAEEAEPQQAEINGILRSYPLREAAKKLLASESPNISPGFLGAVVFTGSDTVTWDGGRSVTLRVNTIQPVEDGARLSAVARAFLKVSEVRQRTFEETSAQLENYRVHVRELRSQLADLQRDIANPANAAAAELNAQAVRTLEQRIASTLADIDREQRVLDTWIWPDHVDAAGVQRLDTQISRRNALAGFWGGMLVLFGIPLAMNLAERRRKERERRRRNGTRLVRQV